jgi:hypothetical protein
MVNDMFTSMRWFAITVLVVVGCQDALGLQEPVLEQPDAGAQISVDVPEAPVDAAAECPAAPAGCTAFACAATDSCYYACSGHATWVAAQSYCSQISGAAPTPGGSPTTGCLATIGGELEQQCVVAATQPTSADPVWIGLYQLDAAHEPGDGWQWTCGGGDWRGWASFEPYDLVGDRDCSELAASGGWKAEVCGYSRRFVCKVDVH